LTLISVHYFKCLERGHYSSECPHKRTIILKGENVRSQENFYSSPREKEVDFEEEVLSYEGESLLV